MSEAKQPEPTWRSDRAHEVICEAAESIANQYCNEDDTYTCEVRRLIVAISEVVDRATQSPEPPQCVKCRHALLADCPLDVLGQCQVSLSTPDGGAYACACKCVYPSPEPPSAEVEQIVDALIKKHCASAALLSCEGLIVKDACAFHKALLTALTTAQAKQREAMRSRRVEKLRERANRYQKSADDSLPNDQTAARTAAAAALKSAAKELESLSIQEQEK